MRELSGTDRWYVVTLIGFYTLYMCNYTLMRDGEGRKKEASKVIRKATQHTQISHFPKKNDLPRVGLVYMCIHVYV